MKVINGKKIMNAFKLSIFILMVLAMTFMSKIFIQKYIYPLKYMEYINDYCAKNSVDPYFVLAVIKAESNFDIDAVSSKNAKGLMQITQATASDVMDQDNLYLHDARTNISIGTEYLAKLIEKYNGNVYLAIAAYNAGMGNVDKWLADEKIGNDFSYQDGENIPFKETRNYVKRVIFNYNMYKILY